MTSSSSGSSLLKSALHLSRLGFKLFPVRLNDKRPAVTNWQEWAEDSTTEKIRRYVCDEGNCNWGILPAASGHLVLDIDSGYKKKDKKVIKTVGDMTLAQLEKVHGKLPSTFAVRTPSGGRHLYFKGTCRPTQSVLGKHIDTRSEASYVVAPGSTYQTVDENGNESEGIYAIINDVEPAECPQWVLDALKRTVNTKPAPDRLAASKLDTESNIAEAMEFLHSAPLCSEGEGKHGGEYLLNIFMELRDRGISQGKAKTLVLQNYNDRCDPPWDMADEEHALHFHKKLHNAYTYAQNPIGIKTEEARTAAAQAEFTGEPESSLKKSTLIPLHWVNKIDSTKIPKRKWIMERKYAAGEITSIIAPGGMGKSSVTMADAVAISSGKALTGFKVQRGSVWLYNLEDSRDELERRFLGLCECYHVPLSEISNLAYTSGRDHPLTLAKKIKGEAKANDEDIERLIETIQQNSISILFLDPFSRCYSVMENDNSEMNIVMNALTRIATETGCAICIVHHSSKAGGNKNADPGDQDASRGASAIPNAVRISQTLSVMTQAEAKKYGIPEERRENYVKLTDAKANLYLKNAKGNWYLKESIQLQNGDEVGVFKWIELAETAGFVKEVEKEEQKKEVLEFLRTHLSDGSTMPLSRLQEMAEQEKLEALKDQKNITTFQKKIADLLPSHTEFHFSRGQKNAWLISREDFI